MARNFPADHKLQKFFAENYDRESAARLQWYFENKRGGGDKPKAFSAGVKGPIRDGLPTINPMQYALQVKRREKTILEGLKEEARRTQSMEEMKPVPPNVHGKLYDGFTKEEKGRYLYMKDRNKIIPEKKYPMKYLSSWEYGWNIEKEFKLGRPRHARSKKINDTFFINNGIPTLGRPTVRLGQVEREYTLP